MVEESHPTRGLLLNPKQAPTPGWGSGYTELIQNEPIIQIDKGLKPIEAKIVPPKKLVAGPTAGKSPVLKITVKKPVIEDTRGWNMYGNRSGRKGLDKTSFN